MGLADHTASNTVSPLRRSLGCVSNFFLLIQEQLPFPLPFVLAFLWGGSFLAV